MSHINVVIHVLANIPYLNQLVGYENVEGKYLSNENEIKVNKTSDGFSVIFTDDKIAQSNPYEIGETIVKMFLQNVPNNVLDVYMVYYCKTINGTLRIDQSAAQNIIALSFVLSKFNTSYPQFNYCITNNIRALIHEIQNQADDHDDDNDIGDMQESYYEDDEDDKYDAFNILDEAIKGYNRKHKKGKKKKKHYDMSRVIKSSKNPKKMYKRHGIVVCKNKRAIDKDKRLIKDFLMDFIPGKSSWKKEFRRELCKRWMQMYVLTPGQLKSLQKDFRKKHQKPKSSINTERTLEITRKLFGVTNDIWSDPTR